MCSSERSFSCKINIAQILHKKGRPKQKSCTHFLFLALKEYTVQFEYECEYAMGIPGSAHANLGLGGLAIVGGAVGYLRKGSKPSLLAGLTVGSIFLGSGYMIAQTDRQYEAHLMASGTGGIMAVGMAQRWMKTSKFMPAGMIAILGAAACAYNAKKSLEWAP